MLKEIYNKDFKPSFQYLVDENSFVYDNEKRLLSGQFSFQDSPYLEYPDKILNFEDGVFINTQSLFVLFANYYADAEAIKAREFANNLLGNIIVTKVSFEFNEMVLKANAANKFTHQLTYLKHDRHGRLWYKSKLSISGEKHRAYNEGCVMTEEVHR